MRAGASARTEWIPEPQPETVLGVGVAGGAPLQAQAHAERPRAVRDPDMFGMKKGGTTEKPRPYTDGASCVEAQFTK